MWPHQTTSCSRQAGSHRTISRPAHFACKDYRSCHTKHYCQGFLDYMNTYLLRPHLTLHYNRTTLCDTVASLSRTMGLGWVETAGMRRWRERGRWKKCPCSLGSPVSCTARVGRLTSEQGWTRTGRASQRMLSPLAQHGYSQARTQSDRATSYINSNMVPFTNTHSPEVSRLSLRGECALCL